MLYLGLVCLTLVGVIIYLLREQSRERAGLLQRIQAPEAAVIEQAERPERGALPVIGVDDDAAHAQLRERRNGVIN